MADIEQLGLIGKGVDAWNAWRCGHAERPNLTHADLYKALLEGANLAGAVLTNANLNGANLAHADLSDAWLERASLQGANLAHANLSGAYLREANLSNAKLMEANLRRANLHDVNLSMANLRGADLTEAKLREAKIWYANLSGAQLKAANLNSADLYGADLSGADLGGAELIGTVLVNVNIEGATLNGCRIHGVSAWNLKQNQETKQSSLLITDENEADVTVDNLEIAQFVYLLLNRKKLRDVLTTITSKAVLLLGRFTAGRKEVLDALADEARKQNLLPIIFDFERSTNRDFTETVKILAGLSLFVIVDITKPKSSPQELTAVVPDYQIPFVPILEEGEDPYSMFRDFRKYDWVLKPIIRYRTKEALVANFKSVILGPAWKKHIELQRKKNEELEVVSIEDLLRQKEEGVP